MESHLFGLGYHFDILIPRMLDSDTYSWHATNNHPEAIVRHVPSKTKWWGMVSLSGSMHSPHIDADGLCTTMTVTVGYKVFVICSDPNSFSLALNARKGLCIEDCLKSAKWEVVVIPPGATL
jgi:hypothetical protein